MYVGRIVAVGRNLQGKAAALYRVSSRSFPNRMAKIVGNQAMIVPRPGFENDIHKNPYIAYRCLRLAGDVAVATNGSQTDPIAEKIAAGMSIRDALAYSMLALDYEKDDYNTPRISVAIKAGAETGFLAVVRKDGVEVRELPIAPGKAIYLATYEISTIDPARADAFDVADAEAGAAFIIDKGAFAKLTNAVSSVCALETTAGFALAARNV
jgi:IMP cyclohydrolase